MDARKLEKQLQFIEDYKNASNAASGSKYDANANVTSKNISTLQCELGKKDLIDLNRALTEKYLLRDYGEEAVEQFRHDLNNHFIYSHDESSLTSYCASISLYPFLLNGLKDLGGSSGAPKHTNGFIGGLINLIFLAASQLAGALAVPEFLTYMDHFLRLDFGNDYIEHLDEGKYTLRHKIEDWFQQLVYSINQPAGARNYQSPFTNIAYFDRYYFESIFKDFVFPDGDEPCYETTKELQKIFMKWFNNERLKEVLTFPVETANILVENGKYKDEEFANFLSEMWAEGHSFFCYQSDSVDALASCCRLRNEIEKEENVFSYTLGCGTIETGSKKVITLNLNRIGQEWYKVKNEIALSEYILNIVKRVHKYLNAWDSKLRDDYDSNMMPLYKAGFIDLDKQFLTIGVNGFVELAEFLGQQNDTKYNGIKIDPFNEQYKILAEDILGNIKKFNKKDRTKHHRYNTEFVPGENASAKFYNWDKKDGYVVPKQRNLYNSYFFIVEDQTTDPIKKFYFQGNGFASECDGGVANHVNLDAHLSEAQYRKLMDVAVKAGCNYFTYNIPNTICNDCGHIDKRYLKKCPACESTNVDAISRVIGYLKRISNFSEARQIEASRRYYGNLRDC